jgi:hypothetical protein
MSALARCCRYSTLYGTETLLGYLHSISVSALSSCMYSSDLMDAGMTLRNRRWKTGRVLVGICERCGRERKKSGRKTNPTQKRKSPSRYSARLYLQMQSRGLRSVEKQAVGPIRLARRSIPVPAGTGVRRYLDDHREQLAPKQQTTSQIQDPNFAVKIVAACGINAFDLYLYGRQFRSMPPLLISPPISD